MPQQPLRFKVYIPALGDVLRTAAGVVRLFDTKEAAEAVARGESGFIQPADAPHPGGFDRSLV